MAQNLEPKDGNFQALTEQLTKQSLARLNHQASQPQSSQPTPFTAQTLAQSQSMSQAQAHTQTQMLAQAQESVQTTSSTADNLAGTTPPTKPSILRRVTYGLYFGLAILAIIIVFSLLSYLKTAVVKYLYTLMGDNLGENSSVIVTSVFFVILCVGFVSLFFYLKALKKHRELKQQPTRRVMVGMTLIAYQEPTQAAATPRPSKLASFRSNFMIWLIFSWVCTICTTALATFLLEKFFDISLKFSGIACLGLLLFVIFGFILFHFVTALDRLLDSLQDQQDAAPNESLNRQQRNGSKS